MLPGMELMSCPELAVPPEVMHHVVRVESSHNPYAIGVVGGHLVRQPKNLPEALATVRMLESRGFNFSLGVAQVNRYNLGKYGLNSYEKAFEVCPNLQAGSRILAECYSRSGGDWGKSFSCYYSGNFVTGYRHGYVQKIYASMRQTAPGSASASQSQAIPVVSKPSRRTVGVTRYPVYAAPPAQVPTMAAAPIARQAQPQPIAPPDASQAALMRISAATPQEQPVVLQSMQAGAQPAQASAAADSPAVSQATAAELPAVDAAFVF
ncbi:type IV secretion system protein VirB1 [Pseudoxanthomonas sp. CF125]|nr:type IV secretion system protein VirB1 [Pseudoxanthomonas sp. CF125]